ncbi:MAG: hypothetical protein GX176_07515 [Syntrophomonadaceae bacterium]|nr:hypothetical protein [Syntrophomonadaceae bacterium]
MTTEQVRMVNLLAMIDFHLSWPVLQVIIATPIEAWLPLAIVCSLRSA